MTVAPLWGCWRHLAENNPPLLDVKMTQPAPFPPHHYFTSSGHLGELVWTNSRRCFCEAAARLRFVFLVCNIFQISACTCWMSLKWKSWASLCLKVTKASWIHWSVTLKPIKGSVQAIVRIMLSNVCLHIWKIINNCNSFWWTTCTVHGRSFPVKLFNNGSRVSRRRQELRTFSLYYSHLTITCLTSKTSLHVKC